MSGTKFSSVAVGYGHSLAITDTGELYSFGFNQYGQLGLGNTTNQSTPQLVMSGTKFTAVSAGDSHSLAITTTGALYSFGYNYYGQLGNGTTTGMNDSNPTPQLITNGTKFASVAAGNNYSLAITTTGDLYSFGYNNYGQLGIDSTTQQPSPQLVMSGTKFASVAAGGFHSLAITTTGALYSFGYNYYGQLGLGNTTSQSSPQLVMSGTKFSSVAAGYVHSLAITISGDLYSFGHNRYGQLGIGTSGIGAEKSSPQLVMSGTKFASIAAGPYHSLAITTTGDLYSFGYNNYGQLGLGNITNQSTPQPVMSGITFASIAAGGYHSLAITISGDLYSFGYNDYGQLGIGTSGTGTNQSSPQPVMSGTIFASVAAGSEHSLAITTTGDLYSFGRNNCGQLGLGNYTQQSTPQPVMTGTKFSSIAAGDSHSLAIATSGALYSFGLNYYGQLGIDTFYSQSSPRSVMSGTIFASVAAGSEHSLAITQTSDLYSFGYNNNGQLGLGIDTWSPTLVAKVPVASITVNFTGGASGRVNALSKNTGPMASIAQTAYTPVTGFENLLFDAGIGNSISQIKIEAAFYGEFIINIPEVLGAAITPVRIVKSYVTLTLLHTSLAAPGQQVLLMVQDMKDDLTITATIANAWTVQRFLNWPADAGSAPLMSSVQVNGSYIAATAAPIGEQIPPSRTFAGWFTEPVGGKQVTAATLYSSIDNWNSVERTDRIYAQWV